MIKVLFQGDSITDGNRGRGTDPNHILGHSYTYPIASYYGFKYPSKDYEFLNRGVSGNTVRDLYSRWQVDTLSLNPDILSILIGVNDAYYRKDLDKEIYVDTFEETYRSLLNQCLKINSNMKLIILEPFTLNIGNLTNYGIFKEYVNGYAEISRKIASEFDAVFIPLQERFEKAAKNKSASYWIWDSVHPTYNGHGLIAEAFLNDTKKIFE